MDGFAALVLDLVEANGLKDAQIIERSRSDQTAFGRKLENYLGVFNARTFKSHWGVPNLMVLTVTTNATHQANMIAHLKSLADGNQAQRFAFKSKPEFGANWSVPPVMHDLLAEPWIRVAGTAAAISPLLCTLNTMRVLFSA
jgi:hypothetical protein